MLTEFGKALRRIRLDSNELLKDMADKLGVSSAYLSAVENGKKKATLSMLKQIIEIYNLTTNEEEQLRDAFQRSQDEIRVDTSGMARDRQDLAMVFARKISTIDDESIEEILNILNRRKEGE